MERLLALLCCLGMLLCPFAALGEEVPALYTLAEPYELRMGAPLSYNQMRDKQYLAFVKQHFNTVTTTNEMKAYTLLNQNASKRAKDGMPVMVYSMADQMVAWAQQNGLGVRGHVLVWDAYMCDWFFREGYDTQKPYADQETIQKRTAYYIDQVITHFEEKFPGVVWCWDVVNEAVGDNAGEYQAGDPRHLRTVRSGGVNLFREHMGEDYVALSFLYARNTVERLGADIKLYYNDYNAYFADKTNAILALAKSVNTFATDENGQPRRLMDGIGMQGYIGGYGTQSGCLEKSHLSMIKNAMLRYAAEGLEVQVTEMAVRNFDLSRAEDHARYYGDLFRVFLAVNRQQPGALRAITIWGLTDRPHAVKGTYDYNLNSPYGGLVDEKLQYKQAFYTVEQVLQSGGE